MWPATFVVEKNLANLVSEIRDAHRRRCLRATIHPDGAQIWVRISRTVHHTEAGLEGRSEVSFRITWVAGRVTLDEGVHVIGRDPNVEIYLDAPGISAPRTDQDRGRPCDDRRPGKQEWDACRGSATRRIQIDRRWRRHHRRLREADGQSASEADFNRDRTSQ